MPLYEYQCDACGARFERIRKFSDPPLEECPQCGKGPVQKLVSSPAFQFKGSGWYITAYARKSESGSASSSSSADAERRGGQESGDKPTTGADKPAAAAATDTAKAKDASGAEKPASAAATKDK